MTDDGRDIAADSWAFALKLYAEPGVSDACLTLQSEAGVDVMLLLVATFAAAQRRTLLTVAEISELDDVCRPWREQIVRPLRTLRITLKSRPAPAPSVVTEKLRSQIKGSELAAEHIENDMLADWLRRKAPGALMPTRDQVNNVMRHVVRHALGEQHHHRIDELAPAIEVLLSATDKMMR